MKFSEKPFDFAKAANPWPAFDAGSSKTQRHKPLLQHALQPRSVIFETSIEI